MGSRLAWLWYRQTRRSAPPPVQDGDPVASLPAPAVWLWAVLSAGLPLTLPFAARSIASQQGEGALATFNYAWKLVELPLVLAIQLVATLAFPGIATAFSRREVGHAADLATPVRGAFALTWTLACAAAGALLVGAPALAQLLFGWGRMDAGSLARVAQWGAVAAWGLLPQALIAVAVTVLAAQARLRAVVAGYVLAVSTLLGAASWGVSEGPALMRLLNVLFAMVALVTLAAMGDRARRWLPWRTMGLSTAGLLVVAGVVASDMPAVVSPGMARGLAGAVCAAGSIIAVAWLGAKELRQALQR